MSKLVAAYAYCRVAPNVEVKPQHTLEAQKMYCSDRAEVEGYDLMRVYEEVGSGMTLNRPKLLELLKDMQSLRKRIPEINITLLTHDPSRLARDVNHYFSLKKQADVKLHADIEFTRITFEEVDND